MVVEESLICPAEDSNLILVFNKTGEVLNIDQNTMLGDDYPAIEEGSEIVVDDFTETLTCAHTFCQEDYTLIHLM